MTMAVMRMVHDKDPREEIQENIGDISGFELFGNQILLGVYKRPERTTSGLYLADKTRGEDEYQGKAMLVLKKGPAAFKSDSNYDFHGMNVEEGDWVACWVTDGRKIVINGQLCRVIEDIYIRMRIPAPDMVF